MYYVLFSRKQHAADESVAVVPSTNVDTPVEKIVKRNTTVLCAPPKTAQYVSNQSPKKIADISCIVDTMIQVIDQELPVIGLKRKSDPSKCLQDLTTGNMSPGRMQSSPSKISRVEGQALPAAQTQKFDYRRLMRKYAHI
jgi:hypothetical protein